jgi:hypothetical protein
VDVARAIADLPVEADQAADPWWQAGVDEALDE